MIWTVGGWVMRMSAWYYLVTSCRAVEACIRLAVGYYSKDAILEFTLESLARVWRPLSLWTLDLDDSISFD